MEEKYRLLYWNSGIDSNMADYLNYLSHPYYNKQTGLKEIRIGVESSILITGFDFLDQRLASIHQEQVNNNILLGNIGKLLRVPDSEKQRQLHMERGIRFFSQSLKDDDLALDAKSEFEAALKLMSQDWFVLQQLGILHLFNPPTLDPSKAKDYFLKAAKYAAVDSPTDGLRYINELFKAELNSPFETYQETTDLSAVVREAYLNAALAAYILSDFSGAVTIIQKAVNSFPQDPKCLFLAAKYMARNGQLEEAFTMFKNSVSKAAYLCEVAETDNDLLLIPDINEFISKFKRQFLEEFSRILLRLKQINEFITNLVVVNRKNDSSYYGNILACCELLNAPLYSIDSISFSDFDKLFNESACLVVQMQTGSTANLQRRLNLGYNRAGRIMAELESAGIVGPAIGSKPREVLMKTENELKEFLSSGKSMPYHSPLVNYTVQDVLKKWDQIVEKCEEYKRKKNKVVLKSEYPEIQQKKQAPCFIATATLGTDNHQILTDLRFFRNEYLLKKNWGRRFVFHYYKFGPAAAKPIAHNKLLRLFVYILVIRPLHLVVKLFSKSPLSSKS